MIAAHISLPGGSLYNIGYNGLKDLGFPIKEFWGDVIIELKRDDLPVLMKRLNELENKCLEYKMRIYWDDTNKYTETKTKNWADYWTM